MLSTTSFSQQNFFNVPSFECTTKRKIFVQEQININQIFQSNLSFDYGLGKGFQVGCNIIGVDFYDTHYSFAENEKGDKDIFAPLFMLNAQKTFEINPYINFSAGVNQGFTIDFLTNKSSYAQFDFALVGTKFLNNKITAAAGVYYGNSGYFQNQNTIGIMTGIDADIYKNKIHFVGDWISGNTPASVAVLGFSYFVNSAFPISLGWQIPNVSENSSAFVLEITWNPSLRKEVE